jgi:hypothetical protein
MNAFFDDYVAVGLNEKQDSSLFTMEANLENDDAMDSSSPTSTNTSEAASGYGNDSVSCDAPHNRESLPYTSISGS